jgi:hypothetical protein
MKEYTMYIKRIDDLHYCNFRCAILVKKGLTVQNPCNDWQAPRSEYYEDLTITAQKNTGTDDWYGFAVRYMEVYAVDADRAESMLKTLQRINRALAKIAETRGYAQTFAEFAGRVAEVLKADFCTMGKQGSFYSEMEPKFYSIPDGMNVIREMAKDTNEKG